VIGWPFWRSTAWSILWSITPAHKCGGILVPINFRYKRDELVYVVNNSNPKVLFYGQEFSAMVERGPKISFIRLFVWLPFQGIPCRPVQCEGADGWTILL